MLKFKKPKSNSKKSETAIQDDQIVHQEHFLLNRNENLKVLRWSSLISQDVLENISTEERRRQQIIYGE